MRLFVIGANGRTGRQILDLACARGHQVTAFVRSPDRLPQMSGLSVVCGDPRQAGAMAAAMAGIGVGRLAIVSAAVLFPEKGLDFAFLRRLVDAVERQAHVAEVVGLARGLAVAS
jgi:uncharacterized protein YbjT (DUF2867 family)